MKSSDDISITKPVERLFVYPTAVGIVLFCGFQAYGVLSMLGGDYPPDAYYVWSSASTILLPFVYFGVFLGLTTRMQSWRQRIFRSLLLTVPAGVLWIMASMLSGLLYPLTIDYGSYFDLYIQAGTALVTLLAFVAFLWRLRQKGQW